MCGCVGRVVCGYHTQLIADLIDRLDVTEATGGDDARSLRSELDSYGPKVGIVRRAFAREASRG